MIKISGHAQYRLIQSFVTMCPRLLDSEDKGEVHVKVDLNDSEWNQRPCRTDSTTGKHCITYM